MKRINNTAKEFKCQRNNKFTKKKKIRVWLISVVFCRTKKYQKQPSRGGLIKRLKNSANYRRTTMPKCGFNKVALQLYRNHT